MVIWEKAASLIGPTRDLLVNAERRRPNATATPPRHAVLDGKTLLELPPEEPAHGVTDPSGSEARRSAIVEREDLPDVAFCVFELWKVDEVGEKLALVSLAPARLLSGVPSDEDMRYVKRLLTEAAREARLKIVRADW